MDNYDGYDPNHDQHKQEEIDMSLWAVLARHPEVVKWTVAIAAGLVTLFVVDFFWTNMFSLPFAG
jgi:hypothetical protein